MYILQDRKTGRYFRERIDDGARSKRATMGYRFVDDVAEASEYVYRDSVKTLAKLLPQYDWKIIVRN